MIDESNKAYGQKYLFLLVKFYSQEQGNVVIGFLDAHIANEGKADGLVAAVVKHLMIMEFPLRIYCN